LDWHMSMVILGFYEIPSSRTYMLRSIIFILLSNKMLTIRRSFSLRSISISPGFHVTVTATMLPIHTPITFVLRASAPALTPARRLRIHLMLFLEKELVIAYDILAPVTASAVEGMETAAVKVGMETAAAGVEVATAAALEGMGVASKGMEISALETEYTMATAFVEVGIVWENDHVSQEM